MTGRPPFAPTEDQRRLVRAMAGYGVPHDDIAVVVRCSPPTLRKHFRQELDVAAIEANARVAQTLFQQATTPGNIAATIFWLKARAGWREKQVVEHSGPEGAALAPPCPTSLTVCFVTPDRDHDRSPSHTLIEGNCHDPDR